MPDEYHRLLFLQPKCGAVMLSHRRTSFSTNLTDNSYLIECIQAIPGLGGEKNILEKNYVEMELLINFIVAGY